MTPADHLRHLQELLAAERDEDRRQFKELVLDRSLKERAARGVSWYPVQLRRLSIGLGERIVVELERSTAPSGKNDYFQSGGVVSIFGTTAEQEEGRAGGVIMSIRQQVMKVMLSTEQIPDWITDTRLGVDPDFDDKTYQDMQRVLTQVLSAERGGRLAELRDLLLGKGDARPGVREWDWTYSDPFLNASQLQAVQRCLEARDVAIIHGPPGTGKTTTLVHAIRETLLHERQVLVCAPSNTAVDLLTLRCLDAGIEVLRLGNPARVEPELLRHTLDGSIARHDDYEALRKLRKDAEELRRQALKYKRRFGSEEAHRRQHLLKEARELGSLAHQLEDYIVFQLMSRTPVIACTLSGAAGAQLDRKKFSTVFIDEAGQALEPACWIPLRNAERVVMAGDHCQLPPTVKSVQAERGGLGRTLFEQVIGRYPEVSVMLDQQYRMHEQIMRFSAEQFYGGKLYPDAAVRERSLGPGFSPLEFVDTAGCGFREVRHPDTQSLSNPEEAQLLLRHLALLFNQLESEAPDLLNEAFSVGIISPYKDQVKTLQQQADSSPMLSTYKQHLTINTIDGFQGQERDVVYLSLVRSNTRNEIGFLKDTRRMNVALTRARRKLAVFGDSALLGTHAFYSAFLEYAERTGAYRSAWEWMETS